MEFLKFGRYVDAFQQKKFQNKNIFDFGIFWPKNCEIYHK